MATADIRRLEIKRAVIPAAVTAFIAANIFGTQEVITLAILTTLGFATALIVLLLFFRFTPVYAWPLWIQRLGIWAVAAASAALASFIPFAILWMRR